MSHEGPPSNKPQETLENKAERIPTPEEVLNVFKELARQELRETRPREEDAKGLSFLEAEGEPDAEGCIRQMEYRRRPHRTDPTKDVTTIYSALKKDGEYMAEPDGGPQADFIDGKWILKP